MTELGSVPAISLLTLVLQCSKVNATVPQTKEAQSPTKLEGSAVESSCAAVKTSVIQHSPKCNVFLVAELLTLAISVTTVHVSSQ